MHLMYESVGCTILLLHIYTWGMIRAQPMLINNIDLIGQDIIYLLNIYILHSCELLQPYYNYTISAM